MKKTEWLNILIVINLLLPQIAYASDWLNIIRSQPYNVSKNFHINLSNVRQWVLLSTGFCEKAERHILFNNRGQFLGYLDNEIDNITTQQKLDNTRQDLFNNERVDRWLSGSNDQVGYPFALNCNQPHAEIQTAIDRLIGIEESDRLWGTWDGISAGTEKLPIPLNELVELVYKTKSSIINQPIVAEEFKYFLAQIIIESGAKKYSLSKDFAIGLLQLKTDVLEDCQIPKKFYLHRMAQVDCAVRLFQQNRRNLRPLFDEIFGHLPEEKKTTLFSLLLVQSYHSGIGRISRILKEPEFNQATQHFAENQQNYSAEDIATGLIYHNLGRSDFGFASLYYVIDIAITTGELCKRKELSSSWVCQ